MAFDVTKPVGARSVEAVIVHTAADPNNRDVTAAALRAYHMRPVAEGGRGWRDIGYHRVVRQNGNIEAGRHLDDDPWLEYDEIGAQVKGGNARTVGVCFAGNGDLADFTPAQKAAGCKELARLCRQFGIDASKVLGHREAHELHGIPIAYKTCPGRKVDMAEIRASVAFELDAAASIARAV